MLGNVCWLSSKVKETLEWGRCKFRRGVVLLAMFPASRHQKFATLQFCQWTLEWSFQTVLRCEVPAKRHFEITSLFYALGPFMRDLPTSLPIFCFLDTFYDCCATTPTPFWLFAFCFFHTVQSQLHCLFFHPNSISFHTYPRAWDALDLTWLGSCVSWWRWPNMSTLGIGYVTYSSTSICLA